MVRRLLKIAAWTLLALVVVGAGLYVAGLRVLLTGGGTPYLAFVESEKEQLERIARDRAAQTAAPPGAGDVKAPATSPATTVATPAADALAVTQPAQAADIPVEPLPYWTDFRGPLRDGHYRERPILTSWPAGGLTPIWKHPIGGGYASFVIARGRAFTIEQRGEAEVAAAYDMRTGRELWTTTWQAAFREYMGGDGPRATPTWHDGRVYVQGATGELRCLDEATGRTVWRTNILEDAGASNLQWGMAVSPLIVEDSVLVLPGGSSRNSIVAYNRLTGVKAWSALDEQQAYSSPMLVTLDGVRQLIVFSASRVMGLTLRGERLWDYPWRTQPEVNASQPLVIGERRLFVSTGYGTGAAVIELTRGADGGFQVREVWRNIRMKNQFTSSVLHDGFIYGLDESILACLDAATGDLKWKGGRYGYGQVMLASGHLIVLSEDGDLALVRATPERHEELVRFPVLSGKTWNHPAMSDGILLVRNLREMAALDLRLPAR